MPIPEELARDGSGRLADVIPGDWDVICYVAPYSRMREQVRDGLRLANLPTKRVKNVPEFYLGENEYALVVLGIDQKPRILLTDNGRRKRFYFDLQGERFHNARASAIRRGHVAERIWHTRHRHDREPRLTTSGR